MAGSISSISFFYEEIMDNFAHTVNYRQFSYKLVLQIMSLRFAPIRRYAMSQGTKYATTTVFFSCVRATLQTTLSVGRLVGWSVIRSGGWSGGRTVGRSVSRTLLCSTMALVHSHASSVAVFPDYSTCDTRLYNPLCLSVGWSFG